MTEWKIVDEYGDDIMTAETISKYAEIYRTTPRQFAQKEARLLSSHGGDKAIAVRAAIAEGQEALPCSP